MPRHIQVPTFEPKPSPARTLFKSQKPRRAQCTRQEMRREGDLNIELEGLPFICKYGGNCGVILYSTGTLHQCDIPNAPPHEEFMHHLLVAHNVPFTNISTSHRLRCRWTKCGRDFDTFEKFQEHVQNQHLHHNEVQCARCGKVARVDAYQADHGLASKCKYHWLHNPSPTCGRFCEPYPNPEAVRRRVQPGSVQPLPPAPASTDVTSFAPSYPVAPRAQTIYSPHHVVDRLPAVWFPVRGALPIPDLQRQHPLAAPAPFSGHLPADDPSQAQSFGPDFYNKRNTTSAWPTMGCNDMPFGPAASASAPARQPPAQPFFSHYVYSSSFSGSFGTFPPVYEPPSATPTSLPFRSQDRDESLGDNLRAYHEANHRLAARAETGGYTRLSAPGSTQVPTSYPPYNTSLQNPLDNHFGAFEYPSAGASSSSAVSTQPGYTHMFHADTLYTNFVGSKIGPPPSIPDVSTAEFRSETTTPSLTPDASSPSSTNCESGSCTPMSNDGILSFLVDGPIVRPDSFKSEEYPVAMLDALERHFSAA